MTFMAFAVLFCCICGIMNALILTSKQRACLREARLIDARCRMVFALKDLDKRIFSNEFSSDSFVVDFQHFAWQAKDADSIFTLKSFILLFFSGMRQFAIAVEIRKIIAKEMAQVPRLNHAKNVFLQSYFHYLWCRHPIYMFLLIRRNRWMMRRYLKITPERLQTMIMGKQRLLFSCKKLIPDFSAEIWQAPILIKQAA